MLSFCNGTWLHSFQQGCQSLQEQCQSKCMEQIDAINLQCRQFHSSFKYIHKHFKRERDLRKIDVKISLISLSRSRTYQLPPSCQILLGIVHTTSEKFENTFTVRPTIYSNMEKFENLSLSCSCEWKTFQKRSFPKKMLSRSLCDFPS